MSTMDPGGAGAGPAGEEELRAAYEAELKRIRVESLVLEQVVTLINMGMRRTGLAPGTEDERDPEQVRLAIETIRALMPIVEPLAGSQAGALHDALSQLQLAYVKIGGKPGEPTAAGAPAGTPGGPPAAGAPGGAAGAPGGTPGGAPGSAGPAQRSGRLWIPGQ